MQATSENAIYAKVGYGNPLDSSGSNSYTKNTLPMLYTPDSAEVCQMACEGFYDTDSLQGYSFFTEGGDGDNNSCICWTEGNGGIAGTDGASSSGIGITYSTGDNDKLEQDNDVKEVIDGAEIQRRLQVIVPTPAPTSTVRDTSKTHAHTRHPPRYLYCF